MFEGPPNSGDIIGIYSNACVAGHLAEKSGVQPNSPFGKLRRTISQVNKDYSGCPSQVSELGQEDSRSIFLRNWYLWVGVVM